jgi:hypothetical protein
MNKSFILANRVLRDARKGIAGRSDTYMGCLAFSGAFINVPLQEATTMALQLNSGEGD